MLRALIIAIVVIVAIVVVAVTVITVIIVVEARKQATKEAFRTFQIHLAYTVQFVSSQCDGSEDLLHVVLFRQEATRQCRHSIAWKIYCFHEKHEIMFHDILDREQHGIYVSQKSKHKASATRGSTKVT